ncbi:MAG: protein-disulfide reductase DsbD family protein, partial [Bacteroidales bacterium]|nr:protein-disulfide reductase DsbD family protein [Bacteroidales bacterium]
MKKFLILIAVVLFHSTLFSQIFEPVKWSFTAVNLGDNTYELVFSASIDEHWHLYSQHIDDEGPVPTSFVFNTNASYELLGVVEEPQPIEEYSDLFEMTLRFFDGEVNFRQKVKITEGTTITGFLEYMACDDNQCLPPTEVDF